MEHAREAVDAGADIIIAQGGEAGGHGQSRGTLTLVPEIADYLAKRRLRPCSRRPAALPMDEDWRRR